METEFSPALYSIDQRQWHSQPFWVLYGETLVFLKAASEQQQCQARMAGQGSNRGKDAELRPVAEEAAIYGADL